MSKLQVLAITFILLFPVTMFGDQIVLKNGDRLTGSIAKSDDKTLVMKTEFAGEVTVLALSADGSLVAGAGSEGHVEVWRVGDGQRQWSRTMSSAAKSMQFSPDSRRLLVLAENGNERHFDAGNGRPVTARAY